MVVLPMQSISGDSDGTYVAYVFLHRQHAWYAMPAMFGALAAEVW